MTARIKPWNLFLGVGALLCFLYVLIPPIQGAVPVFNFIGLAGFVAVIVGIRVNRPEYKLPWILFAVGLCLQWLGDIYAYSYPKLANTEVPFPSLNDAIYLSVYPVLMAGLVLMIRRRNPYRMWSGSIDSLIMALGLSLVSWVVLIAPYVGDNTLTLTPKLVSIAYPVGDILLLVAVVRLAVDRGKRVPSFYMLGASIASLLLVDFVYGLMVLRGTYDHQLSLDIGWIALFVFWGASALHPSMRSLDQRVEDHDSKLRPFRLGLLACASMVAPVIELTMEHNNLALTVVVATSIVLFGLVVLRMVGLNRQEEQSLRRERILSKAASDMVMATDRDQLRMAAVGAAVELTNHRGSAFLCVAETDGVKIVASCGIDGADDQEWMLTGDTLVALTQASNGQHWCLLTDDMRANLRIPQEHQRASAWQMESRVDRKFNMLFVTAPQTFSQPVRNSLEALATQLILATDSAELTEQVHRRASEERLSSLVQNSHDLITVLDANGEILYQSPSIESVLGYRPEEVLGTKFNSMMDPSDHHRLSYALKTGKTRTAFNDDSFECTLHHRDGSLRQFELLYSNMLDDQHVGGIVLNGRDISERKAFEKQLAHQAFHDPITNLANRALFGERARHAVAVSRRETGGLAVIFLDIDDFKTINDSLGHASGDEVLKQIAKRLSDCIRAGDTAARFGGDEFAVLLENVDSAEQVAAMAERIVTALGKPVSVQGRDLVLQASLGISMVEGDDHVGADELIRNADAAMYIAKRDGKGGYRMFEPEMHDSVVARLELRADLQNALANGELELYYQPLVHLDDGRIAGVEALMRWNHPARGLVLPDEFIPVAEDTGLIVPMGRWALREGCRQAVEMQQQLPKGTRSTMSINISVEQLQHSDIVADVSEALSSSGLDPELLTVEVTETVVMVDTELAIEQLNGIKALGVRLAMDDFGTGYSSLGYLGKFPVDILKMDRSFLDGGAIPDAVGLTNAVIKLGESLGFDVVAEGIEHIEQWVALRDLGCTLGQGFYFARPMPAEQAVEHLVAAAHGTDGPAEVSKLLSMVRDDAA